MCHLSIIEMNAAVHKGSADHFCAGIGRNQHTFCEIPALPLGVLLSTSV